MEKVKIRGVVRRFQNHPHGCLDSWLGEKDADADGKDTVSVPPDTDLVPPKSNTAIARLLADEL